MGWLDDLNADVTQQQVDDERRQREQQVKTASRGQAQRLARIKREYPWLTPGAAASLAKAGHDHKSKLTREAARRAAERRKKKGFGWHTIGDVVGSVGDFVMPEKAEDVIGSVVRGAPGAGKAAVRGTFTALDTGAEAVASTFRKAAGNVLPQSVPRGARGGQATGLTRGEGTGNLNPLSGTKAGIIAEKVLSGDADEIDLGTGFFPGGGVAREQKIRARDELSLPGPNGRRSAVTPGRLLAYTITEPGTTEYKWTSGLVDAAWVLGTDPGLIGGGKIGQLRQARKLIDPSIAGGIKNATRRTAITELANGYLDGPDGRKVVEFATKERSAYKIYRAFGEKISAEEADELAALADPADVVDYIRPKLGTSLREKPYVANPLTRGIKPVDGYSQHVPESIRKRIDGVRLFHVMPGRHVDPHDSTDVAVNMMRAAQNAKLGPEKAEEYFNLAAKARGPIGRFNVVNEIQSDIAKTLLGDGVGRPVARGLTKMYDDYVEMARKYYTDDIGNNAPVLGAQIRGVDHVLPTPHLWSEYINRTIPMPDPRAIRRATSKYGRVLNHMTLEGHRRPVPVAILDFAFQDVWKPLQLIRGAWTVRVVGEEQIRLGAMGKKSLINHPIQAILWATHRRGNVDALGDEFRVMDDMSEYVRAQTRRGENWRDRVMMMGQVNVRRGGEGYGEAGAHELAKYHDDPITRRVIAGLSEGDGVATRTGNALTDTQEWFWSGAGQKFRKEMAEGKGREALLNDRTVADELIQSMWQRVNDKTGGRAELLEAVATGKFNGAAAFTKGPKGLVPSKALQEHIDALGLQGVGPQTYVGELTQRMRGGVTSDIGLDHAVDSLFNVFMSRPTNFLSRSPAFRQFYWQRIEELIPAMNETAQMAMLAKARKANLQPKVLRRMEKTVERKVLGELTVNDTDVIAKAYGLDETKRLLYDLTERSQFFDVTRHIFPFGEAWGEVLKVWARVATERPQTIRKAQLAINGARGSGFFYPDENGEEVFNYPGTGFVTEQFAGVPAPFQGRVQGLNIFSNNPLMPGVGPMVQIPASHFLPRKGSWQTVRDMVLPFGDESVDSGILESQLPAWMQKMRQTGKTPFGREDQRLWNNTWMEAARYLQATGKYKSQEALDAAATKAANRLYALRGMAQFFAPSAPSPEFMARDKEGRLTTAFKLTEEFRKLVDADVKNDTDTAVEVFLNTYGPDALLYMQNKSEGGGPVSSTGLRWVNDHAAFVKKYPLTYALFAPQDEGFNYTAYTQLIKNGSIKPLSKKEFVELANNRVAAMIYRQAQAAVGEKRSEAETQWLRDVKERLTEQYPGYNTRPYDDKRVQNQIRELAKAAAEPAVSESPVAKGVRRYLEVRGLAIEEAQRRGLASFNKAKKARNLRAWLREHAAGLSAQYEGFSDVFERVFEREFEAEDEEV